MVVVEGHLGDLRRGGDHRHGGGSITMGVDVVVVQRRRWWMRVLNLKVDDVGGERRHK
jgi:hypothetical protein